MGIYLNPGNQGFWESIRSKIYVDKTNLIACTNELLNTCLRQQTQAFREVHGA